MIYNNRLIIIDVANQMVKQDLKALDGQLV